MLLVDQIQSYLHLKMGLPLGTKIGVFLSSGSYEISLPFNVAVVSTVILPILASYRSRTVAVPYPTVSVPYPTVSDRNRIQTFLTIFKETYIKTA
jgi:hypothetical protein